MACIHTHIYNVHSYICSAFFHICGISVLYAEQHHTKYIYVHSGGRVKGGQKSLHTLSMNASSSFRSIFVGKKYSIFLSFFPHTRYECPHYFGIGFHTWIMAMITYNICSIWYFFLHCIMKMEGVIRYMKIHWLKWIWEKANGIITCMHGICIKNNIKTYGFFYNLSF